MERPQCVVPPMGQTHLESGWASPSIQWWLLDQVLGSSVGTRTAALTHPCRGFLEEFLFCINVFTNDRQSLEKFPSKSLSHIAYCIIHEQTKFAQFLENLSNFSLVWLHCPDSQRYLPLSPTPEIEQNPMLLPPSTPNILSLSFVCRKILVKE